MPPLPESLKNWIDFAKQQKAWAVEQTDRGDIPPTLIVERDGNVQAIVVAPEINKYMGLQAASMCKLGFDPDALTMVMDAHVHSGKVKEGQTPEEAQEEFRKKYPKGMQHACDEDGACATGDITDCLICHRITRDGSFSLVTLPYSYHGKDGPPFKWLDDDPRYKGMCQGTEGDKAGGDPDKKGLQFKGLIPDNMREIMAQESILDQIPQLKEMAEKFNDFTPERTRYHTARAMMAMLSAKKFMVVDFVSGTHPEWTGAKETGNQMLTAMVEKGFFPKEAYQPIKEILDAHIGTKEFAKKLLPLLNENSYWLPNEVRDDIGRFVGEFETICMSPAPPPGFEGFEDDEGDDGRSGSPEAGDAEPKRVRVWNGDQSEFLGEGNYVGNVPVFFIRMPDGSLRSNTDAETEPDHGDVPPGGEVVRVPNNPKIVLDNGQTVYGCQVWWEPIEHQHHAGCKHNHA